MCYKNRTQLRRKEKGGDKACVGDRYDERGRDAFVVPIGRPCDTYRRQLRSGYSSSASEKLRSL